MAEGDSSLESLRKAMQYPLIKVRAETCRGDPRRCPHLCRARQNCDMPEEMRQDCVDLVITAIERFQGNYEVRACGARSPCRLGFSSPPPPPEYGAAPAVHVAECGAIGQGDHGQEVQ